MIRSIERYLRIVGVRGLAYEISGRISRTPALLQLVKPDVEFPLFLRIPSSDVLTYDYVFLKQAYAFDIRRTPRTIVDAGANIGLASIYFTVRFPNARIIAIEPELSNFSVLKMNTSPYGNIVPVFGALWNKDTTVTVVDPNLGKWGFMTQGRDDVRRFSGHTIQEVKGMTVSTVMKDYGIDRIDILKMNIEGAEREVFSDSASWISDVDALIVELHERMKPGCNRSFYRGSEGFDNEWLQGENVYLTRTGACLERRCI